MSLPNPIVRTDYYLNKIADPTYDGEMPNPITREDHYLKAIAENGGGGGGAAGSFIDVSNIITSGTHTHGMTYTATTDCFFVSTVAGNNTYGAWARIDGVEVAGGFMVLNMYLFKVMLHVKAGQTVTLVSPYDQEYDYTVYGVK